MPRRPRPAVRYGKVEETENERENAKDLLLLKVFLYISLAMIFIGVFLSIVAPILLSVGIELALFWPEGIVVQGLWGSGMALLGIVSLGAHYCLKNKYR